MKRPLRSNTRWLLQQIFGPWLHALTVHGLELVSEKPILFIASLSALANTELEGPISAALGAAALGAFFWPRVLPHLLAKPHRLSQARDLAMELGMPTQGPQTERLAALMNPRRAHTQRLLKGLVQAITPYGALACFLLLAELSLQAAFHGDQHSLGEALPALLRSQELRWLLGGTVILLGLFCQLASLSGPSRSDLKRGLIPSPFKRITDPFTLEWVQSQLELGLPKSSPAFYRIGLTWLTSRKLILQEHEARRAAIGLFDLTSSVLLLALW